MMERTTESRQLRMAKLWSWGPGALLLIITFLFSATSTFAEEGEFPGRKRYFSAKWVSIDDLYKKRSSYEIVDVRSEYEFQTLHIKGASNIPLGNADFVEKVRALRAGSSKAIAFYCNGRSCNKSYEAVLAAQGVKIPDVVAYDAGVFEWVRKYPQEGVLLGVTPVEPSKLMDEAKLKAHMLSPDKFEQAIGKETSIVLDVRDSFQQDGAALYPLIQISVPLDNNVLKTYVEQALKENKTLMVYDATGQQVQWLQYYIESLKVRPSYYFMEGGAKAYYDGMRNN